MNNDEFKDFVRTYSDQKKKNSGARSSSKVIARKAVEEEFRKKKRKRCAEGDLSYSSDEDCDHELPFKRIGKRQQQQRHEEASCNDSDGIHKGLSTRYRDRAKERREGKLTGADEITASVGLGIPKKKMLVPQNIKGLDLTLVKKGQLELEPEARSDGGNRKPTTTAKAVIIGKNNNVIERKLKLSLETRHEMPTLDQANQILRTFLTRGNGGCEINDFDNASPPMILSNGLVNYLSEILKWKILDVSTWEGEPSIGAPAWYSLQHKKFSLAIDGNPSDAFRAWENPRQYTLSQGGGSGVVSSSALLPTDVMIEIYSIFRNQNDIREGMMKRQMLNAGNYRSSMNVKREKPMTDNDDRFNSATDEDESDDDIFGGLDD